MLLDIEQRGKELIVSYYNKEGNTAFKNYSLSTVSNWAVCNSKDKGKSSDFTNWDGRPVRLAQSKAFDKYSLIQFLENLPEEESYEIFEYCLPKIYFVDIEVEVTRTEVLDLKGDRLGFIDADVSFFEVTQVDGLLVDQDPELGG